MGIETRKKVAAPKKLSLMQRIIPAKVRDVLLRRAEETEADEQALERSPRAHAPVRMEEAYLQVLVTRAQEGDSDAFEEVYQHFFLPLYRYTAFRVPSEMVEDLVADVFVKSWEKLHQYKIQKGIPFGAWLFRIARHTVIDAYRRERDFEEVPEDIVDHDILNRADTRVRRKDTLRIVREAMAKLPKRYRDVLLLSYVAELTTNHTARVLKMTEGGVRILKFRALKKLESHLPPEMRDHA